MPNILHTPAYENSLSWSNGAVSALLEPVVFLSDSAITGVTASALGIRLNSCFVALAISAVDTKFLDAHFRLLGMVGCVSS